MFNVILPCFRNSQIEYVRYLGQMERQDPWSALQTLDGSLGEMVRYESAQITCYGMTGSQG